jgi:hypothetical protein
MPITLEIEGRPYEVAPFKIGDLRKAAPFIDEINARNKALKNAEEEGREPGLQDLTALFRAMLEVLSVGLIKIDPELTADRLEEMVDFTFLNSLKVAVFALMKSSGLGAGEAKAPSPPAEEGAEASASSSAE